MSEWYHHISHIHPSHIPTGKASLLLPEHQSIVAGSSLLVTIINISPSIEIVNEVVSIRGKDLVESILKGIGGDIDRSELDVVSNILSLLLQYYVSELAGWMEVRYH